MGNENKILNILIKTHQREEHIHYQDPFKVLIRCIISQRNRDKVTNRVTKALFERWNGAEEISDVSVNKMQNFLKKEGLGIYKNKGEWIVNAAEKIIEDHNGIVPENEEKLLGIKGIGRKCMNIIMAYGFGNQAIPVDTHVKRISERIGLVSKNPKPKEVEKELKKIVSKDKWFYLNHAMVDHGKKICKPKNPDCENCPVNKYCKFNKEQKKNN